MKPIVIFYHCVFQIEGKELPSAVPIISEQMKALEDSGLLDAADQLQFCINGGTEGQLPGSLFVPLFSKSRLTYHNQQCRTELRTILMMQDWAQTHPDWYLLYFHAKGSSHPPGSSYGDGLVKTWREGMMQDLVVNWRQCVSDLENHDIVCSHWMWNCADGTQHIPAGNFLWVTSNFVAKLPSMYLRDRIKQDGIDALSSRFEAEVFWGNGERPNVKSYRPDGGGGVP